MQSEEEIAREAYRAYQEKLNLKPGDIVKVKFKTPPYVFGWNNGWPKEKDKFIDQNVVVIANNHQRGIKLRGFWEEYHFPAFSLEVVSRKSDEKPEEDVKETIQSLKQKLLDVYEAGKNGIAELGHANYRHRIAEAEKALDKAMYPDGQPKQKAPLSEQDAKDAALLNQSIKEKWKPMRDEGATNLGSSDCPLCSEYKTCWGSGAVLCDGCPIKAYTGEGFCKSTPCHNYGLHQEREHDPKYEGRLVPGCKECETLCQKEIEFLGEVREWVSSGRKERK